MRTKPLFSYDLPERFYDELADSDGDWTKSGWLADNVLQDLQKTSYIEYLIDKFGNRVEEKVSIVHQKTIKRGCVLLMVIWPAFRMEQHRVNDHSYYALQFKVGQVITI